MPDSSNDVEQNLNLQILDLEKDLAEAQRAFKQAKKMCLEAETRIVNSKISLDKLRETLRMHVESIPKNIPTRKDIEVKEFQDKHPELCQWALDRDLNKNES